MPVTIDDIQDAIQSIYGCRKPNAVDNKDAIIFKMECGGYTAFVCMRLFVSLSHSTAEDVQAISISFTFADGQASILDFQNKDYSALLSVCNDVTDNLDWSTISPIKTPQNTVEVCLYRTIGTCEEDIEEAIDGNIKSQLKAALYFMTGEFEQVATVMHAFATDQPLNANMIKQLIASTDQSQFTN